MRKKFLERKILRLKAKKDTLTKKALESQDANEVRSINDALAELNEEIAEAQEELDAIAAEEGDEGDEIRSSAPANAEHVNDDIARNALGTFRRSETEQGGDPLATMEYRMAFKDYVQRRVPIPEKFRNVRAAGDTGTTTIGDIGALVPTTILNEVVTGVQKSYGTIYSRVRRMQLPGGVKIPIANLGATFTWITEATTAPNKNAGDANEYVEFSYNMGEIRVAQSLLASITALPIFEAEIIRLMTEAYLKAMDTAIISGSGIGQPLGIINDPRIPAANKISFTAAEFSDWTQWRKKLFSKVPISKRGGGEFLFAMSTIESYLLTMKDGEDRPLFRDAANGTFGDTSAEGRFFGRNTYPTEPDIIKEFDTASNGDVIGVFWVPTDYGINENLTFGIKKYYDEKNNEWINKGIVIADGKIIDPAACYIIKKSV